MLIDSVKLLNGGVCVCVFQLFPVHCTNNCLWWWSFTNDYTRCVESINFGLSYSSNLQQMLRDQGPLVLWSSGPLVLWYGGACYYLQLTTSHRIITRSQGRTDGRAGERTDGRADEQSWNDCTLCILYPNLTHCRVMWLARCQGTLCDCVPNF